MKMKITGFSHAKGKAKTSGKPYEMARLFRLTEIRPWKNENGESRCAGFETNERSTLDVYSDDTQLVNNLLLIQYPAELDLTFEPHPEDPTRNIVVGFKVIEAAPVDPETIDEFTGEVKNKK